MNSLKWQLNYVIICCGKYVLHKTKGLFDKCKYYK